MVFMEEDKVLIKVLHQEKGYGHPTALIWIRWIIMCGTYWSSGCITHAFTTSITSRHVWLKSGRSLTRRSLIGRSSSGVHV